MTDWDGMSEDEKLRRLEEAFIRLRAVAQAEEHVYLEQVFAESPDKAWPPAPNTAHPSFERQAAGVRQLIEQGEHTVLLPPPVRPLARWLADPEPSSLEDFLPPELIRLEVRRCRGLAPWVGDPFFYEWRVAVEAGTNRWVAGDSHAMHVWRSR